MRKYFSLISNRIKSIYLAWLGIHLTLLLISGNALFNTKENDAFFPLRSSYWGSFFDVEVYDIREFLFYLIIPIIIYMIVRLWNKPYDQQKRNFSTHTAEEFYELGGAKQVLLEKKEAIDYYDKAIAIKPNYVEAYLNRGCVKFDLMDFKSAIEDFNKAIEYSPKFVEAYDHRGRAKYQLKDYRGALIDYNKVHEIEPYAYNRDGFYENVGNAKFKLQDYNGAIEEYSKEIEKFPYNPNYMAFYRRGESKRKLGDNIGAISDYDKAIEIAPGWSLFYVKRGDIKYGQFDYQGALEDYSIAIKKDDEYALAYTKRGLAEEKLGDNNSACLDWSKAEELGDRNARDFLKKYRKTPQEHTSTNSKSTLLSIAGETVLKNLGLDKALTEEDDEILWALIIKTYWKDVKLSELEDTRLYIRIVGDIDSSRADETVLEEWEIIQEKDNQFHTIESTMLGNKVLKFHTIHIERPSKNMSEVYVSHFSSKGSLSGYGEHQIKWFKNSNGKWQPLADSGWITMS